MHHITVSIPDTHPLHPSEDSSSLNADATVIAVADGVTRTPKDGAYPSPSPARAAADIFCQTVQTALVGVSEPTEQQVTKAYAVANQAIDEYNVEQDLKNTDYYERDLAGTVASLAVVTDNTIICSYICDSGVAILDSQANIRWQTADDLAVAVTNWPAKDLDTTPKERQIQIRHDFRNKPGKAYGYGVLTGEPEALDFVKTHLVTLKPNETLVVFSDGALPLLKDRDGRQAICELSVDKIKTVVQKHRQQDQMTSELTLIAVRR